MAKEIERKFLVTSDAFKALASEIHHIRQAYLSISPDSTVRLRIRDDKGYITIKNRNQGATRDEWEYEIPVEDAHDMMDRCHCSSAISKDRYIVGRWEVDQFHGSLEGLVVAEIELSGPDETITLPSFIGREVTNDSRYYNSALAASGQIPSIEE